MKRRADRLADTAVERIVETATASEAITAAWRIHNAKCPECRLWCRNASAPGSALACPIGSRIRQASRLMIGLPAGD